MTTEEIAAEIREWCGGGSAYSIDDVVEALGNEYEESQVREALGILVERGQAEYDEEYSEWEIY